MKAEVLKKLKAIELEKGVEILFAVESGSRAWGFASPDSDYDIRFVYKHKKDWYLNLWDQKDTIEFMTDLELDGSGWDLKKSLKLLSKSNASFLGWLFSPVVYKGNETLIKEFRNLATENFNPVAGFYHYHSMSKSFEETLGSQKMTLKSFFYAIRTALCAHWIGVNETIPPVYFKDLYPLLDANYQTKLDNLILLKSNHIEKSKAPIDADLIALVSRIVAENTKLKGKLINKKSNPEEFNAFFLKTIQ